jgi:hypothetical protein
VEAAVNAASNTTVSNSSFVRVLNTSVAAVLTIKPADGSANATMTLASVEKYCSRRHRETPCSRPTRWSRLP